MKNQEVTSFIEGLDQEWKVEVCSELRSMVHQTIPDAEERIHYKKPHFLKNGKYTAVISPSKAAVAFTIFNAADLDFPEGQFEGPSERKTIKYKEGQTPDYALLSDLLSKAAQALV